MLLPLLLIVALTGVLGSGCGPKFEGRCHCGNREYDSRIRYVVNCTGEGFTDTDVLTHLPLETEVLIFTGNVLPSVPWNIFGTLNTLENLAVIDMSSNRMREIKGKTYHKVKNVERLILNHNDLVISSDHPRIFSNFINLKELHLTDAFSEEQNEKVTLADDLHDIFTGSNLTALYKLHLEQNEIVTFDDRKVFCALPQLHDLHLADNSLTGISFDVACIKHLRFLDLRNNHIESLSKKELWHLDAVAASEVGTNVGIDLGGNPFSCNCSLVDFVSWLRSTNITVRNLDSLKCVRSKGNPSTPLIKLKLNSCPGVKRKQQRQCQKTTFGLIVFSIVFLLSIAIVSIYLTRYRLHRKLTPLIEAISKKVQYTHIKSGDNVEDI